MVSILYLSGNGTLNYSLDCSRQIPDETLTYITWKGKLPASTWVNMKPFPTGWVQTGKPFLCKTRFQIQKNLDLQNMRPCHILRDTEKQHTEPGTQERDRQDVKAVVRTHLCARPRHIAAISREGRPVISPSICERIPLISSVTIGLCIQLKFSFSCSVEINGPTSGTIQHFSEVLLPAALCHYNWFSHCNPMITQVSSIFDAQGSNTPSSPHS